MKRFHLISLIILTLILFLFLAGCAGEEDIAEDADGEPRQAEGVREGLASRPDAPTPGPKVLPTRATGEGWLDWDADAAAAEGARAVVEGEVVLAEEAAAEGEMPAMAPMAGDAGAEEGRSLDQNSALTAGEVDDNALWDDYLLYLRDYSGPQVLPLDVSERHQIRVVDGDGRPVLGAVIIATGAGGEEIARLRTHSDGRAYFFPRAQAPAERGDYRVQVEAGGQSEQFTIPAGSGQREWEVVLQEAGGRGEPVRLDVLFLIDATGSMADEIQQLKDNIQSIADRIDALPARPDVRFAMTIYRDRGDAFISRTFDFTPDVAFFAEGLSQVEAGGGGDYPEDLNEALARAIHAPEWRVEETVSLIFLVADAPPHLDYSDQEITYADSVFEAARRSIKIYPIASSGLDDQGEYIFRQLAQITGGRFIFLTYGSGGPGTTGGETEHHVDDYTVSALDDLVVRVVEEELASLERGQ